jgi:hypothetical protein
MVGDCCRDRLSAVEGTGLELHAGRASTVAMRSLSFGSARSWSFFHDV